MTPQNRQIKIDYNCNVMPLYWVLMAKDYILNDKDIFIRKFERHHTLDICSNCLVPFGKHSSGNKKCPNSILISDSPEYKAPRILSNIGTDGNNKFKIDKERTKLFKELIDQMKEKYGKIS